MKYFSIALKVLAYLFFGILILMQINSLIFAKNIVDFLIHGAILSAVGLYFAVKWQRDNKHDSVEPTDQGDE